MRIATYNIEWFDDHFEADNALKTTQESQDRFDAIKSVLEMIDVALLHRHPALRADLARHGLYHTTVARGPVPQSNINYAQRLLVIQTQAKVSLATA